MGGESERQELDAIVASGERSRGEAEEAEDVDDVLCGGGERRRAEVEGGDRCDGRRGMTLRGSMMGVGSWHLFLALFAALMGTASSQLTPIIERCLPPPSSPTTSISEPAEGLLFKRLLVVG
jgi:hypothetical protein